MGSPIHDKDASQFTFPGYQQPALPVCLARLQINSVNHLKCFNHDPAVKDMLLSDISGVVLKRDINWTMECKFDRINEDVGGRAKINRSRKREKKQCVAHTE